MTTCWCSPLSDKRGEFFTSSLHVFPISYILSFSSCFLDEAFDGLYVVCSLVSTFLSVHLVCVCVFVCVFWFIHSVLCNVCYHVM